MPIIYPVMVLLDIPYLLTQVHVFAKYTTRFVIILLGTISVPLHLKVNCEYVVSLLSCTKVTLLCNG